MNNIIYSIIPSSSSSHPVISEVSGVGGTNMSVVCYREIGAVVSDIEISDRLSCVQTAIAYGAVVEQLARHISLLPVKFGTCMPSASEIRDILRYNYVGFMNNLHEVAGKEEYGLKVFLDLNAVNTKMDHDEKLADTVSERKVFSKVPWMYVSEKLKQQ